jgi:hypothetical protein
MGSMNVSDTVEHALLELERRALAHTGLRAEFEASRAHFVRGGGPFDDDARRRHREWFLLERTSGALGDIPLHTFAGALVEAGGATADVVPALLDSRIGVYEVQDVEAGRGLWLFDVLGLGSLPIREETASIELVPGDLVVGRLYSGIDGAFVMSSAMGVFRSSGLVDALRADVERLRNGRRGSLRIAQDELEVMFFGVAAPVDVDASAGRAREQLALAGFDDEDFAELSSDLRAALAGDKELASAAIEETLERAAFESEADLDALRRALADWWGALLARSATPRGSSTVERESAARRAAAARDAREALAAFDAGRAQGRDLEALFGQLEADLGLDREESEDPGTAPDFPGVVGAMVAEFVWEHEIESPGSTAAMRPHLDALAARYEAFGVFEELSARHVLEFATTADLSNVPQGRQACTDLLAALRAFAQWAEREHDHPLWRALAGPFAQLEHELPRTRHVNARLPRVSELGWSPNTRARFDASGSRAVVRDDNLPIEIAGGVEGLVDGDWLVGRTRAGRFEVALVLPKCASALDGGSNSGRVDDTDDDAEVDGERDLRGHGDTVDDRIDDAVDA